MSQSLSPQGLALLHKKHLDLQLRTAPSKDLREPQAFISPNKPRSGRPRQCSPAQQGTALQQEGAFSPPYTAGFEVHWVYCRSGACQEQSQILSSCTLLGLSPSCHPRAGKLSQHLIHAEGPHEGFKQSWPGLSRQNKPTQTLSSW